MRTRCSRRCGKATEKIKIYFSSKNGDKKIKMKAVLISDKKKNLSDVYSEYTVKRIGGLTELDTASYTKEDVLMNKERFSDTEYIFSTWGMPSFTKEEIEEYFPSLKCVFYSAGSVQSFARPFLESKIKVFSAWAANAVPVAEYTLAQILLANKGFFTHTYLMDHGMQKQARALKNEYPGNFGEKIGIIGVGMIGSLVAKKLKDYRLEVLAFDPFLPEERAVELGVRLCSLEELFSSCRVVSNHLANNAETKGMLNYDLFSKMLPHSTFLNTGRGAQVVEDDLVRLLEERPDVTAVLDVTYPEPARDDHKFYSLANCFLTPHIAGSLGNEVHRMSEYMADEFEKYLSGEVCRYEVSLSMLETMA